MAKCDLCKRRVRKYHVRVSVAGQTIYEGELCERCRNGDPAKGIKPTFDSEELRRKWDKELKSEHR